MTVENKKSLEEKIKKKSEDKRKVKVKKNEK